MGTIRTEEYKKKADPALDRDFDEAAPFAKVRVGEKNLYWKKILTWNYVPLDQFVQIYRRVEEVNSKTCCCSSDFSRHSLILIAESGEELTVPIGEGLYRHEPEHLMEELAKRHPEIRLGKN